MTKYLFLSLLLLVSCHRKPHYLTIDDGLILEKRSGDVFQVNPDQTTPFKYIGNLNKFRKEQGLDKKRCREK